MAREPVREWTRGQAPSFPRVLTMPFFSLLLIEFERLVLFPDSLLGDRLIVISPMVEIKAGEVAEELGIKVYSYAEDIREEL